MEQQAVPVIALYETYLQGNYFLTLDTTKKINSIRWDPLPLNNDVIDQVNSLGTKQKQPDMPMQIFEWAPGLEIDIPDDEDEAIEENDLFVDCNLLQPLQDYNVISDDDINDTNTVTSDDDTDDVGDAGDDNDPDNIPSNFSCLSGNDSNRTIDGDVDGSLDHTSISPSHASGAKSII